MMFKPNKVCLTGGCNNLAEEGSSRCPVCKSKYKEHIDVSNDITKKFYWGGKWTKCSRVYRLANPVCKHCELKYKNGEIERTRIRPAELVHHKVPLRVLLEQGKNPYSWKYLESLCKGCHDEEHLQERKARYNKIPQGWGVPKAFLSFL